MRTLLAAGVGLAELPVRCDLPEFAAWDGYAALHVQNAMIGHLQTGKWVLDLKEDDIYWCTADIAAGDVAGCVHDGTIERFVRRALIDARLASGI